MCILCEGSQNLSINLFLIICSRKIISYNSLEVEGNSVMKACHLSKAIYYSFKSEIVDSCPGKRI